MTVWIERSTGQLVLLRVSKYFDNLLLLDEGESDSAKLYRVDTGEDLSGYDFLGEL